MELAAGTATSIPSGRTISDPATGNDAKHVAASATAGAAQIFTTRFLAADVWALDHAMRCRPDTSGVPRCNGPVRCGMWGLRVPPRCITAHPWAHGEGEGQPLKLSTVRGIRAGHEAVHPTGVTSDTGFPFAGRLTASDRRVLRVSQHHLLRLHDGIQLIELEHSRVHL
jgi:hypothetical protein